MVAFCVAVSPRHLDMEIIVTGWFSDLCDKSFEVAVRRLAEYRERFSPMPDARSQLIAIIDYKMADLNQHKERLTQNLDQFKAGFAASHAWYGMLNQKLMEKAALLQRYRTRALNRFEKLESKLHQKTETKSGYSGSSQPLIKATFRLFSSTVFSNVGSHRMTHKHKPMNSMSLYRN